MTLTTSILIALTNCFAGTAVGNLWANGPAKRIPLSMRTSLQDAFTSCVIVLKVRRKGCSLTRMASRFGGDWQTMGRRIIFRIIVVAFGMIAAFAVALIFFFDSFTVKGDSMEPTFHNGLERAAVKKTRSTCGTGLFMVTKDPVPVCSSTRTGSKIRFCGATLFALPKPAAGCRAPHGEPTLPCPVTEASVPSY